MAKVITYTPQVVTAGNEIILEAVDTAAYVSAGSAANTMIIIDSFWEPGDYLTFYWNGNSITYTFVSDYTGVENTLPYHVTETVIEWAERLFEALASKFALSNDFIISGTPGESTYTIVFEAIEKYSYNNLTIVKNSVRNTINNGAYVDPELYENYKLKIQLMQKVTVDDTVKYVKFRNPVYIPFLFEGVRASLKYDLSRLVYSSLTGHFTIPEEEDEFMHNHDIAPRYYLHYSFIADNLTGNSLAITRSFYALPGKLPSSKIKYYNTQETNLYADLVSKKSFLSSAPLIKTTDIYSPEKLYFLFPAARFIVRLVIKEYLDDDTTDTRDLDTTAVTEKSVWEFSVGYQMVKQSDYGTKKPVKYDIYLLDYSGTLISEIRTFIIDYTYRRSARYFMFKNSFGVYELLRTTGDASKLNKIEKEFYDNIGLEMIDTDQNRKTISVNQEFSVKINTGQLEKPWNMYYATEFLASEDVYWLKNDRAYAVQVEGSDAELSASDLDNFHDFDFQISADDIDDSFFTDYGPSSELPVLGDFNADFNDDFNK